MDSNTQIDGELRSAGANYRRTRPAGYDEERTIAHFIAATGESHTPTTTVVRTRKFMAPIGAGLIALLIIAVSIYFASDRTHSSSQPASPAHVLPTLAGTHWKLTGATDAGTTVATDSSPPQTLTFSSTGTFSGYDGCNSFTGQIEINPTDIVPTKIVGTAMGCTGTNPVANVLEATGTKIPYTVHTTTLTFTQGSIQLNYAAE